jgi:hypothetical protein
MPSGLPIAIHLGVTYQKVLVVGHVTIDNTAGRSRVISEAEGFWKLLAAGAQEGGCI